MMSETALRVLKIVDGTSVDGPGLRTSIYLAGCAHRCPGCHNPSSWDFDGGESVSIGDLMARIIENDFDVTLSGGDPLYQIDAVIELAQRVRAEGKTVWCYTGFTYEQIAGNQRLSPLLRCVDVIVDGPYVEAMRDTDLLFRGSGNQRLVDVAKSIPGAVVEWRPAF